MSRRRAILIVGMHRSGTSAAARVLNLLGVDLPGPLVGGFGGNPLGHWEPQPVVDLHDAMLRDAGSNVNGVFGVDPRWIDSGAAAGFADAIAGFVETAAASSPLFAVKDPRLSLLLPLWRRALARIGVEPSVLVVYRPALEIAASLRRRQLQHYPDAVWPDARAVLLWLRYSLTAERDSRGLPRAFLAYHRLLQDWRGETRRVAAQLGLAWPRSDAQAESEIDGYLDSDHRHERASGDAPDPWSGRVLAALDGGVASPDGGVATFDAAREALDEAAGLFEPYVRALELAVGATPLRTEYVDFVPASLPRVAAEPAALRLQRELDAVRSSYSWRLTAPLRAAKDRLRRRSAP